MKLFTFAYVFEGKSYTDYILARSKKLAVEVFKQDYIHVNMETVDITEKVKRLSDNKAIKIDPYMNTVKFLR